MSQEVTLNAGVLILMTEGRLYGDNANDSRIPHFPQNTFYVAPVSAFAGRQLPADARYFGAPDGNGIVRNGNTHVMVDNTPPRHALRSSQYPRSKTIQIHGVSVQATLVTSGGSSGVTIGLGYDIGAGRRTEKEIQAVFGDKLKLPQKMVDTLKKSCGHIGIPAAQALGDNDMRNVVRLSQQQVCDLVTHAFPSYERTAKGRNGLPLAFPKLDPALREVVVKICYHHGSIPKSFRDRYDAGLAAQFGVVKQCEYFRDALNSSKLTGYQSLVKYIEGIYNVVSKGGKVLMSTEPLSIRKLLDPKNPTLDWVDKNARKNVSDAARVEPERLREAYARIGETYVPNNNPALVTPPSNQPPVPNVPAPTPPAPQAPIGSAEIKNGQQVLIDKGFLAPTYFSTRQNKDLSNADGIMGNNTRTALREMQAQHGLSVTGEFDAATRMLLANPSQVQRKGQAAPSPNPTPAPTPAPQGSPQTVSLDASIIPCYN